MDENQDTLNKMQTELDTVTSSLNSFKTAYSSHFHDGNNSQRINASDIIGFLGTPSKSVSDATVAPTNTPSNGTSVIQYSTQSLAYNNSAQGSSSGALTVTASHTCAGINGILIVGLLDTSGSHITGATYGIQAMTSIATLAIGGGQEMQLFYLLSPTNGGPITITGTRSNSSGSFYVVSASYTGALQSAQPNVSNTNFAATPNSTSVTTTVPNCWTVGILGTNSSNLTGLTPTLRQDVSTALAIGDSNGAVAAGSNSMVGSSATGSVGMIVAGIAPFTGINVFLWVYVNGWHYVKLT